MLHCTKKRRDHALSVVPRPSAPLMSPFAEFSAASSKLYSHPLSPFAHIPMADRVSAGLDLMHRLSKEYEKPEFSITSVRVEGIDVAVQQQEPLSQALLPPAALQALQRQPQGARGDEEAPDGVAGGGAAVGPPLDAAARHRCAPCCVTYKVFITDWTDARMVNADVGLPPRRLRGLRAGSSSATSAPRWNVISVYASRPCRCSRRSRCWPATASSRRAP